jgi:starvation-inducible DNA-binding protein
MNATHQLFSQLFANLYALQLKTQSYHWHVKGPHFKQLHEFFEEQYGALSEMIDSVAERMVSLGFVVPATLSQIQELKTSKDGQPNHTGQEMVSDLGKDYVVLVELLYKVIDKVKDNKDEGSITFLTDILVKIEKMSWMVHACSGGF